MPKKSAGILAFRKKEKEIQFFLVHPGGPFWAKKDNAAWSIPKGEMEENEDHLVAAKREFNEETGLEIEGDFIPLIPIKQSGGKIVYAWAVEAELDENKVKSNEFSMEWPPKSGQYKMFPEIDKAAWFFADEAREKIVKGQVGFIEEVLANN
jgi:predicted NUDIX family NTP pyrophosphohydrolase